MSSSPTRNKSSSTADVQRTKDLRIQKIVEDSQHSQIDSVYKDSYKFWVSLRGFERCRLTMKNDGSYLVQLRETAVQTAPIVRTQIVREDEETTSENNEDGDEHPRLMGAGGAGFGQSSIKYNLLLKVHTLYGRTKIILSSPLLIENNTRVKLYVLIELNDRVMHWRNTIRKELPRYQEISVGNFGGSNSDMRQFAIIFELLPGKVYYVPLVVAYNFKIYTTPNINKHQPSIIFDIRGYNLRIDDATEVCCQRVISTGSRSVLRPTGSLRMSTSAAVVTETTDESDEAATNDNDFYLIKQLILNVRSHKNVMPAMHANYRVKYF